jgi:Domain of unknown function (DUF4261)
MASTTALFWEHHVIEQQLKAGDVLDLLRGRHGEFGGRRIFVRSGGCRTCIRLDQRWPLLDRERGPCVGTTLEAVRSARGSVSARNASLGSRFAQSSTMLGCAWFRTISSASGAAMRGAARTLPHSAVLPFPGYRLPHFTRCRFMRSWQSSPRGRVVPMTFGRSEMTALSEIALALVLYPNRAVKAAGIRSAIAAMLPDAGFEGDVQEDGPLVGSRGALRFSVLCIDRPAPISPSDPSVLTAWHWPNVAEVIRQHHSHLVIAVQLGETKGRTALLEQLAAAAAARGNEAPLAVHFEAPDLLMPPDVVTSFAPSSETILPNAALCVALRFERRQRGPVRMRTQGLTALGLLEIEGETKPSDIPRMGEAALALAGYLIEAGEVVKDGDTFGPDERTRFRAQLTPSFDDPLRSVYRIAAPERLEA